MYRQSKLHTLPGLSAFCPFPAAQAQVQQLQQQQLQLVRMEDRVGALTSACEAAQKERSALQQILESKVGVVAAR